MSDLKIGWLEIDITPPELPVFLRGQFHARLSEGVKDPLKAAICAMDSGKDHVIFVACDIISISDKLREMVRSRLKGGMDPTKVVFHATHTHTGPELLFGDEKNGNKAALDAIGLDAPPPGLYAEWLATRLADAIDAAWSQRQPGAIAYGMDYAVLGRNRRWVNARDKAIMYRMSPDDLASFRHIEGYEDHSLNLLATYNPAGDLTGLIVNVPCPAQEEEQEFRVSADFWHETRLGLRKCFGEHITILPQCSAAGDLTSHLIYEKAAHQRMLKLRNHSARQEIANRIVEAVGRILPVLHQVIERNPVLHHEVHQLPLPVNLLTAADVEEAKAEAEVCQENYEKELEKLRAHPDIRQTPRWYQSATQYFRRRRWLLGVETRFVAQSEQPERLTEVHVIRLGNMAFATNPFEYYLDFGIQIKVRSPAEQTFLIQLAGGGTYVPSPRSVRGGGYGSTPASNPMGPEAGQLLADFTSDRLNALIPPEPADQ